MGEIGLIDEINWWLQKFVNLVFYTCNSSCVYWLLGSSAFKDTWLITSYRNLKLAREGKGLAEEH